MKVSKDECEDLIDGKAGQHSGPFEIISNEITNHSRWSVGHTVIVKYKDGKFYRTYYSVGATEYQDEAPWQYENEVTFTEMRAVEKTVTIYEPVE